MLERRAIHRLVGAALALICVAALAQEADDQEPEEREATEPTTSEAIEEVVVIAPWPDGPRSLDPLYEDPLRARIIREVEELLKDREESEWRARFADETESRFRFGYDPRDEYRLRNEMDLTPPPSETTKPATIFRIGF